jgi:hypothetical protein
MCGTAPDLLSSFKFWFVRLSQRPFQYVFEHFQSTQSPQATIEIYIFSPRAASAQSSCLNTC